MACYGNRRAQQKLRKPEPVRRDAREPRRQGIPRAHTRAGRDDSPHAGRQGPRRPVAHGHRQDRVVRDPDRREGRPPARGRAGRRADAHARAGDAGRAGDQGARPGPRRQGRVHLRRRPHRPPDRGHQGRRARRGGHARPRARPPAAAQPEVRRREDAGARRGRPHARHGLRGRDGPDHGVRAAGAADPPLLGHGAARHPRAHLPLPERARVGPAVRGPDLRQGSRAHVLPDSAHAQGGHALQDARVREPGVLDDLLQHARGDASRLHLSWRARASPPPCCRPTFRRRSASA